MLSEWLQWIDRVYNYPGAGLAHYLTFRAGMAGITALAVGLIAGPYWIKLLRRKLWGEVIRSEGPITHHSKAGTPTLGGILILGSLLVAVFLWCDLRSTYLLVLVGVALWTGFLGAVDDVIKVRLKNKKGLHARVKLLAQVGAGGILGVLMLTLPEFYSTRPRVLSQGNIRIHPVLRQVGFQPGDKLLTAEEHPFTKKLFFNPRPYAYYRLERNQDTVVLYIPSDERQGVAELLWGVQMPSQITLTNIPFLKTYVLNYARLAFWEKPDALGWGGRIVFILVVIFILTSVSNAINLTDGLDGLAAGISAIAMATLGILAYLSGNRIAADYLHILYLPYVGEVAVFASATVGALLAFLWYNTYPAQVFMGDTGSLALGALIAASAIMIKKELLLPVILGVPLVETLSVMMQVTYFRYTRWRTGTGKRIFRMAPWHHHLELLGWHEAKIVTRLWILSLGLSLLAIITLKIR
ncbi:MAG: phospho-N-acetylmuramoyl-pentapeptide-transferase [Bacteroidia bacterium]